MSEFIGSSRSLTLGLSLSVLLHAAGAAGLSRIEMFLPARDAAPRGVSPDEMVIPPPSAEPLILGIEDSPHKTDTWLGFKDPTPHSAMASTVEQAEMTPAPGAGGKTPDPGAPGQPNEPTQTPLPTATPAPETETVPPTPPPEAPQIPAAPATSDQPEVSREPEPTKPQAEQPPAVTEAPTEAPAPIPPPEPVKPAPPQAEPVAPKPEPAPPEAAPADPTPPLPPAPDTKNTKPATPAGSPAAGDRPGEKSDRESSASALTEPIEVVPGRPAAAKGLEIKTVRPRWSETTKLVAVPRNPVVRLTFARSGRVSRADFVKGQNTGWKEVDEPLLDALYRWTAKGEALTKLPPTKNAGLTVEFRIMLRG